MNVYEMLSRDNYLTINKILMKNLGIQEAIMVSELCYRRQLLDRLGQLADDGFFYATVKEIEEETTINEYNQRKILDKLKSIGLVKVERREVPAKRFIFICEAVLSKLVTTANFTELVPDDLENCTRKSSGTNIIYNNNINKHSAPGATGALFKAKQLKTRKSVVQKTNRFVSDCEKECNIRGYSSDLFAELQKFFIMLGEQGALLPITSIREQLNELDKLSDAKKSLAVRGTIQRGWKSLVYMCQDLSKSSSDPAFVGNFTPKDIGSPVLTREESIQQAKDRGEEIF